MKKSTQTPSAFAPSDKMKLIVMTVTVVLLGVGYMFSSGFEKRKLSEEDAMRTNAAPVDDEEFTAMVVIPEYKDRAALEAVSDASETSRVTIEREPLESLFNYSMLLSAPHYASLEAPELDAEQLALIAGDTQAHRAKAFRARGFILGEVSQQRLADHDVFVGILQLEDGGFAHFRVRNVPVITLSGNFVRLDGLFFKQFSAEGPDGHVSGPLLVGKRILDSLPTIDTSQPVDLAILADVLDDTIADISGVPQEAQWALMAHAASDEQKALDWSTVPELTGETMVAIFEDGTEFRGKPFRLPVSRNQASWVAAAGENPLRIDNITIGYIGNQTWKQQPLFKYIAPWAKPELRHYQTSASYVKGHGYFLKNIVYEASNGKPVKAPLFVMGAVDIFVPGADQRTDALMIGVLGGSVLTVAMIWFLLMRDKRRASELREELVRRRRARRGDGEDAAQAQPS